MNVAELEQLAADMNSKYDRDRVEAWEYFCDIAPKLIRRFIAADRMADAARTVINSHWQESHVRGIYNLERNLTAYEATK